MSEVSDYQALVERAAYFRESDDPWAVLTAKTDEEFAELLFDSGDTETYKAALRGETKDSDPAIRRHFISEAGDVLYCLVAAGLMEEYNASFEQMVGRTAVLLGNDGPVEDLAQIDTAAEGRMKSACEPGYAPDYFGMQFLNVPPFEIPQYGWREQEDTTTFRHGSDEYPAPVMFRANGLYVLERSIRAASESLEVAQITHNASADEVPLAISALAVVGVNRFDAGLREIVRHNTTKIERRLKNNTVHSGEDIERTKQKLSAEPQDAPMHSGWAITLQAYDLA